MQSCLELIPGDIQRVFVAYSGGLDSSVLLHLLISKSRKYQIIPWHINHGLVEVAHDMEQFCINQTYPRGLELRIDQLALANVDSNIEAEARRQRYKLFEQHTRAGDCILTAHHRDDQAETFLLNALRGSGSAGLRGIAGQRMLGDTLLLRPLLNFSRSQLEQYADDNEIAWFNDPSNQSSRFDRNYLRNQVIPLLKQRWPRFQDTLGIASELQAESQDLLDEIAAVDFPDLRATASAGNDTLDVDGLLRLSPARRKNLLRYWVAQAGLPTIPHARLQELMKQLHAKPDALPEIAMPDYSIRLYDRRLFLVPAISIPRVGGILEFELKPEIELGQHDQKIRREEIFRLLEIDDHGQKIELRYRHEGQHSGDRHRLKRLFQKHRIPPWERSAVAQVYLDGKLAGLLP
ncbi:MAG: tRNA lysidine(34) synthetase TilS [Gammaproteobacteria bacterium]|nr:tRNA lysidine(34) synthetase TilS [Gammaproteobacteria bacterium]